MKTNLNIIGLTCHYTGNHDNSAALLIDGKVVFAESEERISRIKHDTQFPLRSITHALRFKRLRLSQINYFVSASPPTNIFKLLVSYFKGFSYTSPKEFIKWFIGRTTLALFSKRNTKNSNLPSTYSEWRKTHEKLVFVSHYLAHAETAYSFSGWDKCLVVSWDGYGID